MPTNEATRITALIRDLLTPDWPMEARGPGVAEREERREQIGKHLDLLALDFAELEHRRRNMLQKLLTMASQLRTQNRSSEDFHDAIAAFVEFEKSDTLSADSGLPDRGFIGHILSLIVRMQAGIDISRVILSGPDVLVDGTAVQFLKRAIPELATNALKHGALGPRGGKVEISWIEETEEGRGLVLLRWQESCELDAPSDPAGSGGGTRLLDGLGLTLGVPVDCVSNGGGYRYSFRLPTGRTRRDVGSANAPCILCLEDDPGLRDFVADGLSEAGYAVIEAGSTAGALQVLANGQAIDVALLDRQLEEGSDSLAVADALTARGVPFFFLSGFENDIGLGRHAGAPQLRKPISMEQLVVSVAAVIGKA